jgi:hypothetical protein
MRQIIIRNHIKTIRMINTMIMGIVTLIIMDKATIKIITMMIIEIPTIILIVIEVLTEVEAEEEAEAIIIMKIMSKVNRNQ